MRYNVVIQYVYKYIMTKSQIGEISIPLSVNICHSFALRTFLCLFSSLL
jgi:hypothetical protein